MTLLTTPGFAQKKKAPNPAFAEVTDDPNLPRVLLIGDSISIGYTVGVRENLAGEANVHRIPVNGGPTTRGLESIDEWLGDSEWDVIHFNWGLHDLKYINDKGQLVSPSTGKQQVPIDEYERNLSKLVDRLKETGATLIWRNTTPVPEGSQGRTPGDEVIYNTVAAKIMEKHGIPTDDQYAFVKPQMDELMLKANVHFTKEGYAALAKQAAKSIRQKLPKSEK
ncbi:SGNH/GDSL hydrolase family protein [Thalassoglobus sp. JC818]|uniref:SGNH/GDSL hydrolase family protein n=1 Tax=Thalassoglobus sp. JC818 TaxID=3232136 RepID=UPI0034593724